jgi:hypothetical protein
LLNQWVIGESLHLLLKGSAPKWTPLPGSASTARQPKRLPQIKDIEVLEASQEELLLNGTGR